MGHRLFEFDARSSFGLLVFTPKQSTVIYGNDHTLVVWNFIWPSVIGVLEKGAPKSLSLLVKRRGESSAHCKWMPLGEMSPGLAKLSGPHHPLVSVLNFTQSKKTFRAERQRHSKTFRAERRRQPKSYRAECRRHGKSFRAKGKD